MDRPPSIFRRLAVFLLLFAALQGSYAMLAGTAVERFFVETAGSRPAALAIDLLTPEVAVEARGTRLVARGGGINIRNGCEGTETLFLLLAAFAVAPRGGRARWLGIVVGTLLVFALNQVRIVGLFYAFRSDRALFDLLHTLGAPLLMVLLVALFFHAWLQPAAARSEPAPA